MSTTIAISPIAQFKKAFLPLGSLPYQNGIVYPFRDRYWAENAHNKAIGLILETGIRVTARVGESIRMGLIITPVPEEEMIDDEVPGEVMEPDWWNGAEERE
jgi:hypothetical protein